MFPSPSLSHLLLAFWCQNFSLLSKPSPSQLDSFDLLSSSSMSLSIICSSAHNLSLLPFKWSKEVLFHSLNFPYTYTLLFHKTKTSPTPHIALIPPLMHQSLKGWMGCPHIFKSKRLWAEALNRCMQHHQPMV